MAANQNVQTNQAHGEYALNRHIGQFGGGGEFWVGHDGHHRHIPLNAQWISAIKWAFHHPGVVFSWALFVRLCAR